MCQFAFCGYILGRPELLGIDPQVQQADLEAFNYFWDVVGHCMGLQSRFNLCAGQVGVTRTRVLSMTSKWIGPAFIANSNDYVKIVLDFVDIFWYFRPVISLNSILFLSNRLAGIPGHYLSDEERTVDVADLDEHKEYLPGFNRLKLQCELYTPKCNAYSNLSRMDKLVIDGVVHLFKMYATKRGYRWALNSLIRFGRFCKERLSFMVVGLGLVSMDANYWTIRRMFLQNLRHGEQDNDLSNG